MQAVLMDFLTDLTVLSNTVPQLPLPWDVKLTYDVPRHSFTGIHVRGCLGDSVDSPDSFPSNPILSPPPVVDKTFSSGRLQSGTVILERIDTASLWVSRSHRISAPPARSELDQPGLDDLSSGSCIRSWFLHCPWRLPRRGTLVP